jgi:hypothetical protein
MDNQLRDLDALSLMVQRLLFRTRILTTLCVLLGAALVLLVLLGAAAPAPKVIEATRFVLRDVSGRMRAELSTDEFGPKLKLYDAGGVERVQLFEADKGASGLILSTNAAERFGAVQLFATTDASALLLNNVGHQALVTVRADQAGPSMELLDAARFSTEIGVSKTQVPATGEHRTSSAASIVMWGSDQKMIWSAP